MKLQSAYSVKRNGIAQPGNGNEEISSAMAGQSVVRLSNGSEKISSAMAGHSSDMQG